MRGKLKIFYSYIAGAGKTYAMLQAAHQLKANGHDVVVGYVEPHTRPDTMALVEGLEVLPPAKIAYKNLELLDLDLEAVLARKPETVLIDELAHSNAAGMRHTKRYQDVLDILDAGINVYTTLNIQHLVSLQDVIKKVSKIDVTETLPDYIFDQADQVELVDIEPLELHQRLLAGKIYASAKVDKAMENFFSEKKLSALREIALRRGAARLSETNRKNQLGTTETVLACLSPNQDNGRVVRAAARLAKALKGDFYAIYVETDAHEELDNTQKEKIDADLKQAKSLGGQIEHVQGAKVAQQIVDYASMVGATKIVMGRTPTRWWLKSRSIVDEIVAALPEAELHMVPLKKGRSFTAWDRMRLRISRSLNLPSALQALLTMVIAVAAALVFDQLGVGTLGIIGVILTGVLAVAFFAPSILYPVAAVVVAIASYNFFFVEPFYTFAIQGRQNLIHYLLMVLVTFCATMFTAVLRRTTRVATRSSSRMAALLNANRRFALANTEEEIMAALTKVIGEVISEPARILTPEEVAVDPDLSEKERGILEWSMQNLHSAGRGTDTLKDSPITCFPIHANDFLAGIVLLRDSELDEAQKRALKAVLSEAAAFTQKVRLLQIEQDHRDQAEKERLKLILLRGVSHDMRTPLAVIAGAADTLIDSGTDLTEANRQELLGDIKQEALEMSRTIDNLLGMTKVTSTAFKLNRQLDVMEDVVETAIEKCATRQGERKISLLDPAGATVVKMDSLLMVQVLVNLIDNAIKHTAPDGEITVSVKETEQWIQVKVTDNGVGIDPQILPHIFEDFFSGDNAQSDARRGIGLGLGICRSVVEEHGGHMFARNNAQGAEVGFAMPKTAEQVTAVTK
ncbi:hypothetical protein BSR28_01455 [Boudabousia liubingyangii]|uniref:ATP-binding protein n=1 Tax=Boudabousia liubingyangii TaxID=1921764 RepID=UPI00093DD1F5|nr:ATP-binding protein [Boudabousia liubingyangii]OKL48395.1 hypothetical protein BSR28_01455 [Boudabousia liubingyangii]